MKNRSADASVRSLVALVIACLALDVAAGAAQPRGGQAFDSNGVPIAYVDKGQGEPVVLIHGFTGSYARHWEAPGVIELLTDAGYRVIALDCRGHGESGKPRDPNEYGLEMVRDVVRLLDQLHIERAHVAGYSMGGAIVNQLLVRYPARLRTGILLGAGWEGEDLHDFRAWLRALADGLAKKDSTPLFRAVTGQAAPSDADVAAANASLFARNDPDVLAAVARGMIPLFEIPAESLRTATLPMLAIVGEHDPTNIAGVKRMAAVVRGLEIVELPGATHATSVKPAGPHIVAFLNRHR